MRDQVSTGTEAMYYAYNAFKKDLKDAASDEGVCLEHLIQLPDDPKELIAMFPSDFDIKSINGNNKVIHCRSSGEFRHRCSLFRR